MLKSKVNRVTILPVAYQNQVRKLDYDQESYYDTMADGTEVLYKLVADGKEVDLKNSLYQRKTIVKSDGTIQSLSKLNANYIEREEGVREFPDGSKVPYSQYKEYYKDFASCDTNAL